MHLLKYSTQPVNSNFSNFFASTCKLGDIPKGLCRFFWSLLPQQRCWHYVGICLWLLLIFTRNESPSLIYPISYIIIVTYCNLKLQIFIYYVINSQITSVLWSLNFTLRWILFAWNFNMLTKKKIAILF